MRAEIPALSAPRPTQGYLTYVRCAFSSYFPVFHSRHIFVSAVLYLYYSLHVENKRFTSHCDAIVPFCKLLSTFGKAGLTRFIGFLGIRRDSLAQLASQKFFCFKELRAGKEPPYGMLPDLHPDVPFASAASTIFSTQSRGPFLQKIYFKISLLFSKPSV